MRTLPRSTGPPPLSSSRLFRRRRTYLLLFTPSECFFFNFLYLAPLISRGPSLGNIPDVEMGQRGGGEAAKSSHEYSTVLPVGFSPDPPSSLPRFASRFTRRNERWFTLAVNNGPGGRGQGTTLEFSSRVYVLAQHENDSRRGGGGGGIVWT